MIFQFQQAFCNFDKEVVLIIHLLNDFNNVWDELISDFCYDLNILLVKLST